MKLRNKRTGEIEEFENITRVFKFIGNKNTYSSLAELNEEWEDYEEPKEYWHIGCEGDVFIDNTERYLKIYSSIGNDFNSREEAEKVVEKLKAWKRLKDKNFRYCGWMIDHKKKCGKVILKADDCALTLNEAKQFYEDLDLLFGGEE